MPLDELRSAGVIAVLRAPSPHAAIRAVDALVRGGITGIEITYSTPQAAAVIGELNARYGPEIHLGAGTLLSVADVREAADAGARFLVTPGVEASLARAMRQSGRVAVIGALSPTEIMAAQSLGADAVKIFPSSLGGPAYLRALSGPFPGVPFIPTGGVSAASLAEWFAAGAVAVAVGGELCPPAAMRDADWDRITRTAANFVAAHSEAMSAVAS